jgi:starch synthase (maltosyl-transferring)
MAGSRCWSGSQFKGSYLLPRSLSTIVSIDHDQSAAQAPAAFLAKAKAAGVEAAICSARGSLFDGTAIVDEALIDAARDAGMRLLVEIDCTRVPIDHPLVETHPHAFAIRRSGDGDGPVDPRRTPVMSGEARARLRSSDAAALLLPVLTDALVEQIARGVAGFRLIGAARMSASFIRELIAAVRAHSRDALFLADVAEIGRAGAKALTGAGLDGLVSSFGWWDFTASWLIEEREELHGVAPLLSVVSTGQLGGADEPVLLARRLAAAAAIGDGLIVPAALIDAGDDAEAAFAHAVTIQRAAADFTGTMRRLSGASAPVTAILRGNAPDMRRATRAMLLLINTGNESCAVPMTVLEGAGAALGSFGRIDGGVNAEMLRGGEVRVLVADVSAPICERVTADAAADAGAAVRLVIEDITPQVEGGEFPVKRVVGERVTVEAVVFADGHEQLAVDLLWRAVDQDEWRRARMTQLPNDGWRASFPLARLGRHVFAVEGWVDRFGGFRRDFKKKLDAGVALPVDHAEGRALVDAAVERGNDLGDWPQRLAAAGDGDDSAALLLSLELAAAMDEADDLPHRLRSAEQPVDAERLAARYSSWYELFPRSITDDAARHGTFADVIGRLPAIRDMGFDTLYFPPIHPIGRTHRKGPNNTLTAGPDDSGSPYAIGSAEGGHDAIHPDLGSFDDFDALVKAAAEHGLEIALDFAIQASPDHPWLTEHPGWFAWRPDGSMKYAENPPKKYQDIVNVDFYGPDAVPGLWTALRDVVLLWVQHGVKTFRVDNPHTKPLPFWEWMIGEVRGAHPDVIFLAEAFTRPSMMYRLAKIGFSQSYTYFTWRDGKAELTDYITELTTTAPRDFYRPHFFVNTPDINPIYLQTSGRAGFRVRAVLAATLSGLFGVYSGFELCEAAAIPGKEEYLDSEKYIVKPRDWQAPGNIIADITLLNRLRRAHPALQTHLNTRFFAAHNDNIIYYGKPASDGTDMILVMVNLDPHHAHDCDFEVPLWEFGLADHDGVSVEDLAGGHRFHWHGKTQHIRLEPDEPYRIWRIAPGDNA